MQMRMAESEQKATADWHRVFFTHGGEDAYVVEHFLKPKVERTGATVFVDIAQIDYGDNFRELILGELSQCSELLVLLTPSSLRRPWVFAEIGACLARGIRIVAVTYGVTEEDLQRLGILSLLGPNNLLKIDSFDSYVLQLDRRVAEIKS